MRIATVHIEGLRALDRFDIEFDPVTVLIGPNGAGKSTVLQALDFFFNGAPVVAADVTIGKGPDVAVRVTFTDIDMSDRAALGSYATGQAMTLERRWQNGETKLTGRGRRFPGFHQIRSATGAVAVRAEYNSVRQSNPTLALPPVRSAGQVDIALRAWEHANDSQCVDEEVDATHLFGIAGSGKLAECIRFVRVPALPDDAANGEGAVAKRLLQLKAEQRAAADAKTQGFRRTAQDKYRKVVETANRKRLRAISRSLQRHLSYFLPGAKLRLSLISSELRLPALDMEIEAGEMDEVTRLERQGHGFQRAFLIAALEMLATESVSSKTFRIVLGIEEPELYQHPTRLRRLARVLEALADRRKSQFQVCYTTHSPLLVDQRRYERIRLLGRGPHPGPLRTCTRATTSAVAQKLTVSTSEVQRKLSGTLDARFNEAFFARAVILTEGPSDVGAVMGAADRMKIDFDARGIAVLGGVGKTGLAVRWAVLAALGIPCLVIFDGDANCGPKDRALNRRLNLHIQTVLGVNTPADFPLDTCAPDHACFRDNLERYLESQCPTFKQRLNAVGGSHHSKPAESYRRAVAGVNPIPPVLRHVVDRAVQLAS